MTNSVTFDTSGWVAGKVGAQGPRHDGPNVWRWGDLSPFCQGFVEAAFASLRQQHADGNPMLPIPEQKLFWRIVGFSDLHPSTLARFMEDCERFQMAFGDWPLPEHGRGFWKGRQDGRHPYFPPLRLFLSDEGEVMAEEAAIARTETR